MTKDDLWFLRSGENLVAEVVGTSDKVTIDGWFDINKSADLKDIVADGFELDSGLSQLLSTMATYSKGHPGFNPTAVSATMPDDATLQHQLAVSWHTA